MVKSQGTKVVMPEIGGKGFLERLPRLLVIVALAAAMAAPAQENELRRVLDETSVYYQKFEEMSVYYFCRETVKETIYPLPVKYLGLAFVRDGSKDNWARRHLGETRVNEYVYDYQMLRRGKKVTERRNLLRENGVEKLEANAELKTSFFTYEIIGLGPVAFDRKEMKKYDFQLLGMETRNGKKAIMVESRPRYDGISSDFLWGRYWIDPDQYSFIRTELAQQSIRNFQVLDKIALQLQATPRVILSVDYGVEHGGIRYPSRFFLEEGYIGKDGQCMVLSSLEVTYEDYRFFRVDVEVKEKMEREKTLIALEKFNRRGFLN